MKTKLFSALSLTLQADSITRVLTKINFRLFLLGILLIGFNHAYGQTYCFTAPQGYASGTTGGGNASPVTVTTQSALQSALTAPGSGVIVVSGTITCTYMSVLVT